MNTTKLSDAELNQKIHELLGLCNHIGKKHTSIYESGGYWDCECGATGFCEVLPKLPDYANSYDAIIPVVQGMGDGLKMDVKYKIHRTHLYSSGFYDTTPRQLAEAVYEVLSQGGGE